MRHFGLKNEGNGTREGEAETRDVLLLSAVAVIVTEDWILAEGWINAVVVNLNVFHRAIDEADHAFGVVIKGGILFAGAAVVP